MRFISTFLGCACFVFTSFLGFAQKNVPLREFRDVVLRGSFDVELIYSLEHRVEITGDATIISKIQVEQRGDVVEVKEEANSQGRKTDFWSLLFKKNSNQKRSSKHAHIKVYAAHFHALIVKGSGNVKAHQVLKEKNLSILTQGVGDVLLDVDIEEGLHGQLVGSGDISLSGRASKVDLGVFGSGDVSFSGEASRAGISLSGSGDISFLGRVPKVTVSLRGSGDIDLSRAVVEYLDVDISGSGDVVYSSKKTTRVSSKVQGSGSLHAH